MATKNKKGLLQCIFIYNHIKLYMITYKQKKGFLAFILKIRAVAHLSIAVLYSLGRVGLIFRHEEESLCIIFVFRDFIGFIYKDIWTNFIYDYIYLYMIIWNYIYLYIKLFPSGLNIH